MTDFAKPAPETARELSTVTLLQALAAHAARPLVFRYGGRDVLPGYHVTEIKAGRFEALDCGANPEAWTETFIQLWDVPPERGQTFMTVGKFLAIMRKSAEQVPFDPHARLTFEVSDGVSAMQLLRASSIDVGPDAVRVALTSRPASCKPRDRWLEQKTAHQQACCGPQASNSQACCA
jgi:hypothetical protein